MPVFWWMRLDLVFLVGRTTSSDVFWRACDLIMILGSLSANEWGGVSVWRGEVVFLYGEERWCFCMERRGGVSVWRGEVVFWSEMRAGVVLWVIFFPPRKWSRSGGDRKSTRLNSSH